MTDALLARLTAPADTVARAKFVQPPWPTGLAPMPIRYNASPPDALPRVDAVVCAFTQAEGQALADVLSPGHELGSWIRYTKDWGSYLPQLSGRSPAKEEGCLGSYALTQIGDKRVLLFKMNLHPAYDGPTLPLRQLWRQIVADSAPALCVSHGTAGGVGAETVLGDVLVATSVRWDCQERFKNEPWANESYACSPVTLAVAQAESLMAINAPLLRPVATRDPVVVTAGDVLTTDFFAYDDTENHYGLRTFDPAAHMVEMDDAAGALAMQDLGVSAPKFVSVRNASDPQIAQGATLHAEDVQAGAIYSKYGYLTTTMSAIVCAGLVTAL